MKCESDGTFIDETNPSGVVESVQELLRQMSATHVRLHLQAHQENQAALSLGRVLATNTNNITTVIKVNDVPVIPNEDKERMLKYFEICFMMVYVGGKVTTIAVH